MSINLILASIIDSVNRNMLGMKSPPPEHIIASKNQSSQLSRFGNNRSLGFA